MDSYTVGDPIFLIFTTLMQFMHICLQFTHFFLWCTKSRDLRVLGAKKNWILGCEPKKQNFQPCQRFLIFWAIFGDSPRPIPRYQTKADLNCWTPGCYLCWCWCFLTSFVWFKLLKYHNYSWNCCLSNSESNISASPNCPAVQTKPVFMNMENQKTLDAHFWRLVNGWRYFESMDNLLWTFVPCSCESSSYLRTCRTRTHVRMYGC